MGGEDAEKIVRIPGQTLLIKVSPEEEAYRKKYLPDAKRLTDEKLVCTVCSVSLAQNIHKGKDLYIHRALQVLVCEACYNFYGDGCFSADEDGDDKYCRWCGQGGTLYICATCNCAFCQKCTKQNLKASVLADLENDDWKCYICNPRPLFGCRTICWGAQQLNEIGKNKEQERLRKVKERLEKMEAKKKESKTIERKSRRTSLSEDDFTTKKRKRSSDDDSSSPEVLPKRRNRGSRDRRNLNGSIGRRRRDSSSNSESEDNKKITRHSRSTSKKEKTVVHSSSEDDSDNRSKKDKLRKKKKKKNTSDESSDTGKKKPNRRSVKKKDSSDEDSSDDEKPKKKKKQSFKKRDDSSDSSNDEKKKKKLKKKKKSTSSEESSEESKKKKKTVLKKKASSSTEQSDDDESSKSHKKAKSKPDEQSVKKQDIVDSDNDSRKGRKVTTDSEEVNSNSPEDILVKKRIKLAILWLNTIVKDISELGTLISLRATKFSKKKINAENLKSYEDVLNCVSKIKQLVSGVHSNYDHIEKTLDSHLKPWKILTGLEEPDNEKNFMDGNISVANDSDVSKSDETTSKAPENSNTANNMEMNGNLEESKVEKINEKPEETINNWSDDSDDQNETRALISKANETLDRSKDEDDKQSETSQQFFKGLSSINTKDDGSDPILGSDIKESRQISKSDSGKPAESKLQSPKTSPSKSVKDVTGSTEKSSKSQKDPESDSNDDRFAKKSSPLTNSSEEGKKGEDCKNEVRAEKGKTELEGCEETSLQNGLQVLAQNQDSSEEDSAFSSFNLRLKDKWLSENSPKKMNLKDSLKNSSKESEASTVSAKSTNEKDLESKNREELIPKIVLKKVAVGEINEENSPQTTNRSKEERGKKIRKKDQKKDEVKANGLSSEDDGNDDKKNTKKKKVNHCKSKSSALDKKPNVLSSSDDDEQNKVAQKKVSNKEKIKKEKDKLSFESGEDEENYKNTSKERKTDVRSDKVKKENSMCLSSEEEEEEKIQNGRSKMSINIDKSSEDKLKSNSVKKGSKEMLKKNEDVSEKKTKRGTMHEEDSDDEIGDTTENIDKKIKPKENKKSKLKQNNSDVSEDIGNKKHKSRESKGGKKQGFDGNDSDGESSKSKRMKLKKSDKSKAINKSENEISTDEENKKSKKLKMNKSKQGKHTKETVEDGESSDDENTQIKNIKIKKTKDRISETAKNTNKDECSSVGLDSSDNEQTDNAEVKNEQTSYADDDEKASENCQVNAETSLSESKNSIENRSSDNECDTVSIQLALDLSSPENTNDTEMVLEEDLKSRKKQKDINEEKPEEMSTSSPEKVESTTVKNKFVGLDSSSDEEVKPKENKSRKKRAVRNQRKSQTKLTLSSDDEEEEPVMIESSNEDNDQKDDNDGDFTVEIKSSPESSDSEILPKNKRKKTNSSDSDDASISGDDTKKKKKKRRRIKCADSSEESGASGDEKLDTSQKNNEGESPAKGGRKNIKKIKKKGDLEQTTIEAAEEEKERRKRIEERQKLFNQVFEAKESAKLDKLVLDFDPESKSELISVNKDLVVKMKPHQAKGVKFMWDSCFESVKQVKKTKGSGCILAHCMGLGKTFQVISLVHTLLTHEEYTKVRTVMVVCPLSTVLNWVNEFGKWLEGVDGGEDIEVFHLTKYNKNPDRARELRRWQHNGGVLIMGYEMFRNLTNETTKKFKAKMKKDFLETLIDPGADLIVCDEGHMLKNEATALSKAMTRVRTLRRIVLTGTPMQNNLKEYHCMVQFVKPNLLGTSKEFLNRFVNPINNGQFVDSTDHDVKLMKRRAHVLHKMLEGLVQRFDYNVLTPFLPPKQEYVISVCLSELQEKLYSYYLENESQKAEGMKGGTRLFMDWQTLGRVWTHPRVLKMSTDKANWLKEKKAMEESDSEGSLRDFIDDDSEKSTTTIDSSSDDDSSSNGGRKKKRTVHKSRSTRSTRQTSNVALLESSDEEKRDNEAEDAIDDTSNKGDWWTEFVEPVHFEDMRQSGKLLLLFAILKECEMIEDKVLVFSQSLFSLDLIEYFLDKIDAATQEGRLDENLDNHQGTWSKGLDYFRLDGSTSSENRNIWCKSFNREDNPRARLFLISTRAGGLGINLTAANRVIIFDASWNPSHDIQSIFRIYRFGQKKPCYVYRFVAHGTMEEKVYERQVAKQSISNRVVDEQQVHRHFSMNDLTELYTFTPSTKLEDRPTPTLPRDPLMAEILSQMKQWIEKYHEHDSLLENVVEEELNEEERKAAWEDYENDKKRGFMPPAGPQGPAMNPNAAWNQQIEIMRQQLKLRYADKSDDEINSILVYQVSILMRQQQQQQMQMAAQMQAAGNMGYRPQMYGNNMMFNQRPQMQTTAYLRNIAPKPSSQQNYSADQVYRMQQQANLARLQQQMAQQQKSQQQSAPNLQSLLMGQAGTKYPSANIAQLQRMKQNYQASRQVKPGVTITEITDDGKPSGSSES